MKKWERTYNAFLKRHQNKLTFAATLPIIGAVVLTRFFPSSPFSAILYMIALLLCGIPILFRAWLSLKAKTIGIELLVTLAVTGALFLREYSECAIVTYLFQMGNYLELRTLRKTRSALQTLSRSVPRTAFRESNGSIEEIDAENVCVGDVLLVKEGGKVPVDGCIHTGEGFFMESSITGESTPAHKYVNDHIFAGSILTVGSITMIAERVGEDTTFAHILQLVEEAADTKSPVERFIDRFAKYYTPFVIMLASAVLVITRNIDTAVTILVLSCPGALVIGAPIANVSGIGLGARKGILFKGSDVIQTFASIKAILFDKTGTLTYGITRVAEVFPVQPNINDIAICAAIERMVSHPLSLAITAYAESINAEPLTTYSTSVVKGRGVTGIYDGHTYYIGNEQLLAENHIFIPDSMHSAMARFRANRCSIAVFADETTARVCFGISDIAREGAAEMVSELRRQKINHLTMLTGDHAETAKYIAECVQIDDCQSSLMPEDKYRILSDLQSEGYTVCFVGDGINDAPALMKADIGIAVGNGTDAAIESSDIVILNSDPRRIPEALSIARRTTRIMIENIIIAVGTVFLLLIGLFMGYIHMSSGMLIHEGSILIVILNAMRLTFQREVTE